ncbi:MAG: BMC domain-containing protein [Spirochaetota bacterium]|nr:BMC domain-containing protein [Spirochaetota bacterium]
MAKRLFKTQNIPSEGIILGLLEFNSIANGIKAFDAMVKTAPINILDARTISPGNYLTIFSGDVASVEESVKKGLEVGQNNVIDSLIIQNLHSQIIPAMLSLAKVDKLNAMGIIETKTVASAIISADQACKTSNVSLLELRLANGLGGKSFSIFIGELYEVESSMEKAIQSIYLDKNLLYTAIIPSPHEDLKDFFLP